MMSSGYAFKIYLGDDIPQTLIHGDFGHQPSPREVDVMWLIFVVFAISEQCSLLLSDVLVRLGFPQRA